MRALASSFRTRFRRSVETRTAQLDSNTRHELADEILDSNEQEQGELDEIDGSLTLARESLAKLVSNEAFLGQRLKSYQEKLSKRDEHLRKAEEDVLKNVAHPQDTTLSHERETLLDESIGDGALSSHAEGGFEDEYERPDPANEEAEEDEEEDEETGEVERNPLLHASLEERERFRVKLRDEQRSLEAVKETHQNILNNIRQLRKKIMILEEKKRIIVSQTNECRDFLVAAAMADHAEYDGMFGYTDDDEQHDGRLEGERQAEGSSPTEEE